jgi:hypothetical protein
MILNMDCLRINIIQYILYIKNSILESRYAITIMYRNREKTYKSENKRNVKKSNNGNIKFHR